MRGLRKFTWKHQSNACYRNISKKLQIKVIVKENDLSRSLSLIGNVEKSKQNYVLQKFILFPGN